MATDDLIEMNFSVLGHEPIIGRNLARHFHITLDHGKRVMIHR